jgi:hypothetical protein
MTGLTAAKVQFPALMGAGHGVTGLAGLAFLYLGHLRGAASNGAWWDVIVITLALIGGLVLFRTLFRDRIPLPLALGHGALALFGLALVYPSAFGH